MQARRVGVQAAAVADGARPLAAMLCDLVGHLLCGFAGPIREVWGGVSLSLSLVRAYEVCVV